METTLRCSEAFSFVADYDATHVQTVTDYNLWQTVLVVLLLSMDFWTVRVSLKELVQQDECGSERSVCPLSFQ